MSVRNLPFNSIRQVDYVDISHGEDDSPRIAFYEFADGTIIKAKEGSELERAFALIMSAQILIYNGEEETAVNLVWTEV